MDFDTAEMVEFFEYLDELRASGETNMFGARPYLADEFQIGSHDAGRVLSAWMQTFDGTSDAETRVTQAIAA